MIEGDKVVPLRFQNFEDMCRDQEKILRDHFENWQQAYSQFDAVNAALAGDTAMLAKMAPADADLGKAEADRLTKQHGKSANIYALATLVQTLRDLCETRDRKLFGHSAVAKRSLRFARANPQQFYGPAASTLPPSA